MVPSYTATVVPFCSAIDIPAGIEAPIRFYITENADKTATLTYRTPSSLFAPYGSADLDTMARELDGIFAAIAKDAVNSK